MLCHLAPGILSLQVSCWLHSPASSALHLPVLCCCSCYDCGGAPADLAAVSAGMEGRCPSTFWLWLRSPRTARTTPTPSTASASEAQSARQHALATASQLCLASVAEGKDWGGCQLGARQHRSVVCLVLPSSSPIIYDPVTEGGVCMLKCGDLPKGSLSESHFCMLAQWWAQLGAHMLPPGHTCDDQGIATWSHASGTHSQQSDT